MITCFFWLCSLRCLAWAQFFARNGTAFTVGLASKSPAASNPSKYKVVQSNPITKAEQLASIRGYVAPSTGSSSKGSSSRGRLQQLQLVWAACLPPTASQPKNPSQQLPAGPIPPKPAVDPRDGSFSVSSSNSDGLPVDPYMNPPEFYIPEEKYSKEGLPQMIKWLLEVTGNGTRHPTHDITGMQFLKNISVGMNKPLDFTKMDPSSPWAANVTDVLNTIHLPVLPPGYGYSNSYTQTQQQLVDLAKFIDYISGAATYEPTLGMLITGFGESLKTALPSEIRLPGGSSLQLPRAAIPAVPDAAPTKKQLAALQQQQQYQSSVAAPGDGQYEFPSSSIPQEQYQSSTVLPSSEPSKRMPPPKLAPLAKFITGVFGPVGFAVSKLQEFKLLPQGKVPDLKGIVLPLTALCKFQASLPAPPGKQQTEGLQVEWFCGMQHLDCKHSTLGLISTMCPACACDVVLCQKRMQAMSWKAEGIT